MNNKNIEKLFPNLKYFGYKTESPATINYNCIAWAAGDDQAVWWPDSQYLGYWPDGAPRAENLEAFVKAFEKLGYTTCDTAEYEKNFEKVAIYTDPFGVPTHAARQLDSGRWTSKLGQLEDIEHDINGLSDSEYGFIAVYMKKPK